MENQELTPQVLFQMIQTLSETVEKLLEAAGLMSEQIKALDTKLRILEKQQPSINIVGKN